MEQSLFVLRACQCPCGCDLQLGRSLIRCVACRNGGHRRKPTCEPLAARGRDPRRDAA